jgi:hypothetical protein
VIQFLKLLNPIVRGHDNDAADCCCCCSDDDAVVDVVAYAADELAYRVMKIVIMVW